MIILSQHTTIDNKIDGFEFTELTVEDLTRIVKPVGILKKIKRIVERVCFPYTNSYCIVHVYNYAIAC